MRKELREFGVVEREGGYNDIIYAQHRAMK